MSNQNPITIENLNYAYGEKVIYQDLNLNIKPGTIFGLLGKNGVGKSTLINLLMGYLTPQSGKCLLFGEPASNLSVSCKEQIALLYEGFISYDFMTIEQIEQFFRSFYPRWKPEHFFNLIELMDVKLDQPLSSLSFGQKSQVVLGLLLAQDAKLLILDDYSMGLDAGYRRLFIDYLTDYLAGTNKTVLITTHVMNDLEKLVEQIAIVDRTPVVYQTSMQDFNNNFNCYSTPITTNLPTSRKIHRIEKLRGKYYIYSFANKEQLSLELKIKLMVEPISFEERFLGYVGKY